MKTITAKLTGIRPLLMHNAAMIDPDNQSVLEIETLKRELKKAKKDDVEGKEKIRRRIEEAEWLGSLYYDSKVGLIIPGDNLFACIVSAAKKTKCGKQAEQGIVPIEDAPLSTKCKTTDLAALYKNPEFSLRFPVRIPPKTGSRVMKVRPMVPTGWSLTITIEFDETVLPVADLKEALETAGSLIGLGDWRPKFGRFSVEYLKG